MTEFITVEPARELAPAFAAWLLVRDPGIQTVSAGGFLVPLALYPDVPSELLYGSYVDGYAYSVPAPQPVSAEPARKPLAAETGPADKPVRKRPSRKTSPERARDTVAAPSMVETEVAE